MRTNDQPYVVIEATYPDGSMLFWWTEKRELRHDERLVAEGDAAACMSAWRLMTGRWDAHRD